MTKQELRDILKKHFKEIWEAANLVKHYKVQSDKWDELGEKIAAFYENEEGEYDEENPKEDGDLGDIGEIAATAFGWL